MTNRTEIEKAEPERKLFFSSAPEPMKNKAIHRPTSDAEAQALITSLGHYVWDTVKLDGAFSHTPYRLKATINGRKHVIHLPGRRGTTLTWLKNKLDSQQEVQS